jgi:hypothetical protein
MMSLLNLLGNFFCPQYPAVYLVRSQAMIDAREADPRALFEGEVGTLIQDKIQNTEEQRRNIANLPRRSLFNIFGPLPKSVLLLLPLLWLPTAVSVAIVYWLSHFRAKSSTFGQRASTMAWLA